MIGHRHSTAILLAFTAVAASPPEPARDGSCADDYVTIEHIRGTIIEIKPAPEPFQSADIYLSGPAPCTTMWMQVLKRDTKNCHVGGTVEARGVVTSDAENNAWQIGPVQNDYMTLGDDFSCS
jgi:hypothetical protein